MVTTEGLPRKCRNCQRVGVDTAMELREFQMTGEKHTAWVCPKCDRPDPHDYYFAQATVADTRKRDSGSAT